MFGERRVAPVVDRAVVDADDLVARQHQFRHARNVVRQHDRPDAHNDIAIKGKGSPYSITECRVPELMPVLGSQPVGDVSHKPGGRLPLLSAGPAVTLATLKRAATSFAA